MKRVRINIMIGLCGVSAVLAGCATPYLNAYDGNKQDRVRMNTIANRQLPPQPVYNRLRWGHLPEVLPARSSESAPSSSKRLLPIMHFELQNSTLREAAELLAASSRYQFYCASSVANTPISINTLGTVDEIADEIAHMANVRVTVDHDSRSIQFLGAPTGPKTPEFYGKESR